MTRLAEGSERSERTFRLRLRDRMGPSADRVAAGGG
jgi:hypothetical protein